MTAYTQTWFINGQHIATAPAGLESTHNSLHAPRSYAYACPHCGEIWARRIILPKTRWFFWNIPCSKCEAPSFEQSLLPGSIWLFGDQLFLLTLPREVLKYEAELLCKLGPIN